MTATEAGIIAHLKEIEAHVHYGEQPPSEVEPFISVARQSTVLISAPHGTRTFRNNGREIWHEEDEYTVGMALLLAERCKTSVIANIWRSDLCDPNWHEAKQCAYKQRIQSLVQQQGIRWVIDLHGAAEASLGSSEKLVDLGTRKERNSMTLEHRDKLHELIESRLGVSSVSHNQFSALTPGTVTSFCQETLRIQAIQVEMKPSVRVPFRRTDASSFGKLGPYSAPPEKIIAMLSALESFIMYLQQLP